MHSFWLYLNSVLIALVSIIPLYLLHWDYKSVSIWDNVFEYVCKDSTKIITCSIIYGVIENGLFFGGFFILYQTICHYHWKWRYHSDITNLLNQITNNNNNNKSEEKSKSIEETTKNMGYKIDPLFITFPWLISPILKWNSFTNFIIHLSYFITYYNLDSLIENEDEIQIENEMEQFPINNIDNNNDVFSLWNYKLSDMDLKLNWPKIINPFPSNFDYEQDIIGYYSVFRTFWSFLIWMILDYILWKENVGLTYLFETGINKIMQQYTKEHCKMINDLLLPHVIYIKDLSNLILSYHGSRPLEQFILIKVKLHECLKYFKLELLFNILTLFTVLASSLRIYYNPVMVNLMNPICYILGITAFIIFVIILVFNGVGSDALHLLREFEEIFTYSTEIGVIVLSITWACIIWKNMRDKKVALVTQQSRSLVKDFLKKIFQNDSNQQLLSNL